MVFSRVTHCNRQHHLYDLMYAIEPTKANFLVKLLPRFYPPKPNDWLARRLPFPRRLNNGSKASHPLPIRYAGLYRCLFLLPSNLPAYRHESMYRNWRKSGSSKTVPSAYKLRGDMSGIGELSARQFRFSASCLRTLRRSMRGLRGKLRGS